MITNSLQVPDQPPPPDLEPSPLQMRCLPAAVSHTSWFSLIRSDPRFLQTWIRPHRKVIHQAMVSMDQSPSEAPWEQFFSASVWWEALGRLIVLHGSTWEQQVRLKVPTLLPRRCSRLPKTLTPTNLSVARLNPRGVLCEAVTAHSVKI